MRFFYINADDIKSEYAQRFGAIPFEVVATKHSPQWSGNIDLSAIKGVIGLGVERRSASQQSVEHAVVPLEVLTIKVLQHSRKDSGVIRSKSVKTLARKISSASDGDRFLFDARFEADAHTDQAFDALREEEAKSGRAMIRYGLAQDDQLKQELKAQGVEYLRMGTSVKHIRMNFGGITGHGYLGREFLERGIARLNVFGYFTIGGSYLKPIAIWV